MSLSLSVWLVVLLAVVGANLPFINDRWFVVWPRQAPKSLSLRLFELFLFYILLGGAALLLEPAAGQIYPQKWEFYATTGTLFLTLAFPGFVFKYLQRR